MAGFKQVFLQALSEISTVEKDQLGDIRWEGNKVYKYVQFNDGAANEAGVAGEVCYYYAPAGVGTTGYGLSLVTSDISDSAEVGAGVLVAALDNNEYGWIQIKGLATLTLGLTDGVDGDPLTPTGSANGTIGVIGADTEVQCAIAFDQSADIIICDFPF